MQDERKKAEIGYQFCLEKQEKKISARGMDITNDTKLLWAKASDWYAHFLMDESRLVLDPVGQHFNLFKGDCC